MQLTIQPKYSLTTNNYSKNKNERIISRLSSPIVFKGNNDMPKGKSVEERVNALKKRYNFDNFWFFGGHTQPRKATVEEALKEESLRQQAINEAEQELQNRINKTGNSTSIIDYSYNPIFPKGFEKIAGYAEEKQVLVNIVGTPIALERAGHRAVVPNGVLLFGPLGTGKTSLATAFAEQLDCRLIRFQQSLNDAEDMKNLLEEAKNAQKLFETDGKRTIIQMDCCEEMLAKGSKIITPFKNLMDNLSEKYHCTIFATANFPERIDDILLRDNRFSIKIGLSPANKENAMSVLKHYTGRFADESIHYDELAEEILKVQPGAAFSNARIKRVVTELIDHNSNKKITQHDLLKAIKEIGPDITKQMLELFKKQIEHVKHI